MKILSVNAGSSSLKFQLYEMPEEKVLISGMFERIGIENSFYRIKINGEKQTKETAVKNHEEAVNLLIQELFDNKIIASIDEIAGIGHRVVHGGDVYKDSVIIDEKVIKTVTDLIPLAPLHNPANLVGIKVFMEKMPKVKGVAVFDTSFHQTMNETSYLYPVPYEWYTKYGVRKYGFHGTSHKYLSERMESILGKKEIKVITCHLGNGGSICAIRNGECVDTSLGFTPSAGIMMGTRSGDIDFAIIPYIMKEANLSLEEVINKLNKESGLLGIFGKSSDHRDVEEGMKNNDERGILAQTMFVRKIVNYIASYYVLLGGVDAICFSGGIGENSKLTRANIINELASLEIKVDDEANNVRGEEKLISAPDSKVKCYLIPTDEELMIAKDVYQLIK